MRILENIPEEHEELKEDAEEDCDEEMRPMLSGRPFSKAPTCSYGMLFALVPILIF